MAFNIPPVPNPQHVKPEQVIDFDIYNLVVPDAEYQLLIKQLIQDSGAPDLFWTPQNGGHWVAARADVIDQILTQHELFSSRRISVIEAMNPNPPFAPLQIDPPDHIQYRKLLAESLSPQAIRAMGDKARGLAIELIEGFKSRGECEFVSDFAAHLPIAVFMSIVGLPAEDRSPLLAIAEVLARNESIAASIEANKQLAAYTLHKIAERRASPGDDLISKLVQAEINGQPLADLTLLGMINLLLLAGLDTVSAMMGFFARYLAVNADFRHQLISDPELIPRAVEELLRRFPIANLARQVTRDCTVCGVALREGDMVLIPTSAFGMDERRFDNSETVDIERKSKVNATFGGGAHRCMGSMLARVELRIFLEEWLPRIPDFQIKPGTQLHVHSGAVGAITRLPLVWDVA